MSIGPVLFVTAGAKLPADDVESAVFGGRPSPGIDEHVLVDPDDKDRSWLVRGLGRVAEGAVGKLFTDQSGLSDLRHTLGLRGGCGFFKSSLLSLRNTPRSDRGSGGGGGYLRHESKDLGDVIDAMVPL